jgi:hypothetical protein
MTEETTPQKARRMGREYAEQYHDRWSHDGRKWIKYAFARGYQTACENLADEIDALVDQWDAHGDQQRFADELSLLLNRYDTRAEVAA